MQPAEHLDLGKKQSLPGRKAGYFEGLPIESILLQAALFAGGMIAIVALLSLF